MVRSIKSFIVLVVLLTTHKANAQGLLAFVSSGMFASANGTGSTCTLSAPCSLATARSILSAAGQGTVNLLSTGGVYRFSSTLAFTSADSGTNGHTITYQAATGQTPILTGAVQITGMTSCAFGCPSNTPSPLIYKITLSSSIASRELYVNGNQATRAVAYYFGTFPGVGSNGWSGSNTVYLWPDIVGTEAVGINSFRYFECPLTSATSSEIISTTNCFTASQESILGGITFNEPYWLANA